MIAWLLAHWKLFTAVYALSVIAGAAFIVWGASRTHDEPL